MTSLELLEDRLAQWSVPSDVREAVRRAIAVVAGEGATLVEVGVGDQVALAVRGQPAAVYLSPSRLSAALRPTDGERAHRSDSAISLDKESETTWVVHWRYGQLDPSRLNTATALMVKALSRYAPDPATPTQQRRRTPRAARSAGPETPSSPKPRRTGRQSEEERRRVVDATVPRCPVPGCNLPMVGGSCGFHD